MNISNTCDCFGCGVCAIACSKNLICIDLNANGFYEPRLAEPRKCSDCGLCINVCSYKHDDLALKKINIQPYAGWSNNPIVRLKCSSGGVGFEIGKKVIAEGGLVCGVCYNTELNRAEHFLASSEKELKLTIGSKYIQSYTLDGFNEVSRLIREARVDRNSKTILVLELLVRLILCVDGHNISSVKNN